MKCWICGGKASTGEHTIKKSDLRAIFGKVSQNHPLYRHTSSQRNVPVKGLKVDVLKLGALLCAPCNNKRTQPFDRSWEHLSDALRAKIVLRPGGRLDLGKVFPGTVQKSMLNVHLYFVKLFGCIISENALPIDIGGFSKAILNTTAHPKVHLAISPHTHGLRCASVGYSDLSYDQINGSVLHAAWYLTLDRFSVRVMYSEPMGHRQGLISSWHPSSVTKCLRISRF